MTGDLEARYRSTTYRIHVEDATFIDLRIGRHSPALDRWLQRRGYRRWGFLTAWNPRSVALPSRCNARRQAVLLESLAGRYVLLPGVGFADAGDWAEPSVFVAPISPGCCRRLGRLFGQRAVLVGRRGGAPELVWCDGRLIA